MEWRADVLSPSVTTAMDHMSEETYMNRLCPWLRVLASFAIALASPLCNAQSIVPRTDRTPPPPPVADATVLDSLEPSSKRMVEENAKFFVVTVDGTYWDRQIWLRRQELRDRMRKAAAGDQSPSDIERAHGASSTAPMDPDDETDGIGRPDGKLTLPTHGGHAEFIRLGRPRTVRG